MSTTPRQRLTNDEIEALFTQKCGRRDGAQDEDHWDHLLTWFRWGFRAAEGVGALQPTPRQPLTDERIARLMPLPCFSSMNVERWSRFDMNLFARAVERTCAEQWGITLEGGDA